MRAFLLSCSALRKEDGTYAPAHLLYDVRMERAGRNSVCEDSRSAPTGRACCLPSSPICSGNHRILWLQELLIGILGAWDPGSGAFGEYIRTC